MAPRKKVESVELAAQAAVEAAAKPKRVRKSAAKVIADAISPPPVLTWKERMAAVDARATQTRAAVEAHYIGRGYGPAFRTSTRWMGRTKGLPFSRHILKGTDFMGIGKPAVLNVFHPTKGVTKRLTATPALLQTFFPSVPPELAAQMLGHA